MKKLLITHFLLLSNIISNGQIFLPSQDYKIQEPKYELDSLFWISPQEERQAIKVYLTPISDSTHQIQEFTILELETYDGSRIYSLKDPKLSNVKEIVQIQFDYFACCVSIENYYFIVTHNNRWIELPTLDNIACDGPEPFEEYRFPAQVFGLENTVIKTESYPDSTYLVDSVSVLEKYIWDGNEIKKQ